MHGWSGFSPVGSILMAAVPDTITPAATTSNSGTDVVISWNAPVSDQGSAITRYRITFKKYDSLFEEYAPTCLGSDPTIFSSRTCTVAMSVFINSPYSLSEGDLIVAVVESLNAIDYSIPSAENTVGALVQTIPADAINPPTRGSSTSETQIEVNIDAVTEDGGSPILEYSLEMDSGSGFSP